MTAPGTAKTSVQKRSRPLLLLTSTFFLVAFIVWVDSMGSSPPTVANPECDHSHMANLALPGATTNVPEYHDCQELINADGTTYGPLVGVYARSGLGEIVINTDSGLTFTTDPATGLFVIPGGSPGISPTAIGAAERARRAKAIAIGEVQSYDKPYPALGIEAGLNCLYIVRVQPPTGGPYHYQGLMISNVTDDNACFSAPPAAGGKWLPVSHTPPPAAPPGYPAVARWDWDAGSKLHGITILCAPDWCDVKSPLMTAPAAHNVNQGSPVLDAPWEQKGRYDEQPLAIRDGAGGLKPSGAVASAFPHEKLGDYVESSFSGGFIPVARTVLPPGLPEYTAKFNFGQGSIPGIVNDVSMCAGSRFKCLGFVDALKTFATLRCWKSEGDKIWWAKILGSDGTTRYRCVTRRSAGVDVPAAARWRWKANDEGLWTRCAQGCCEVYGDE